MFSTFTATPAAPAPTSRPSSLASPSKRNTNSAMSTAKTKAKRHQVSRACDWCRVHRVKCDNTHPCQNCKIRGVQCSEKEAPQVHTLPQAFREIEKLRQKIKELEQEQETSTTAAVDHSENGRDLVSGTTPSKSSGSQGIVLHNTPVAPRPASTRRRYFRGVYASPNNEDTKQYFGPSSLVYFIKWMEDFLATTLQQPVRDHIICFNSANKPFASPFPESTREYAGHGVPKDQREAIRCARYLTTTQEEYFLGLWWQSYHNSIQILNEHAFREHYRSLCHVLGSSRKPSALVDLICAISMQHGIAQLAQPEGDGAECPPLGYAKNSPERPPVASDYAAIGVDDATIAGRWYYYRSQTLLEAEMETPTIVTVQCQILSIIFLSNASFQTSAHKMLGLAVRTAHILGLHIEPDESLPLADRELRKRIWWTLQTLEMKTAMKHGRPRTSPDLDLCSLPSDDYHLALLSSSTTSRPEGVTWLTYAVQTSKLVLAAHQTHVAFFDQCNELLTQHGCDTIYDHHRVLEDCAGFLQTKIGSSQSLQAWLNGVPDGLKSKHKGGGEAYSTNYSALEFERFAPAWLHHQRLLLELLYHHLFVNLFRPFITFPSDFCTQTSGIATSRFTQSTPRSLPSMWPSDSLALDGSPTPLARQNAHSCARHAIALTSMIHDALNNTEHLAGCYEAFQWQWDAAVSIVGFILSNPGVEEIHHDARRAIGHAIDVFLIFGRHFAMATSAASMICDLMATTDRVVGQRRHLRHEDGLQCGEGMEPAFDGTMIDDDTIRDLLDSTVDITYGMETFGNVDFSVPVTSGYFEV
ncbi:fungal-specific transcription factor domain-containing protein [Ampelomyces quisqualis]|uniref:Fungal-specific transcription factor domain-containing protein n=1 Tax=Ampelomyces quisqualis TaxID=50730 RepID=A0A6A5QXX6_AMPQU|nr:fungal-specific transcription factor domain-containing protein [Ampelomyces quisqualis]